MKYRCDTCGHVFNPEDAGTYKEYHYLDGQRFYEEWAACPLCGETDLEDVGECPICHDWSRDGLCKSCRQEIWEKFVEIVHMAKTRKSREAVLDLIQTYLEEYQND